MATLTLTLEPELLEAARLEAERRHISLDQLVADSLVRTAIHQPVAKHDNGKLLQLINEGVLGNLGTLPTRQEIYAERSKWPHS